MAIVYTMSDYDSGNTQEVLRDSESQIVASMISLASSLGYAGDISSLSQISLIAVSTSTLSPTAELTKSPTPDPSVSPTFLPTRPTPFPVAIPTLLPTVLPTPKPSLVPTPFPSYSTLQGAVLVTLNIAGLSYEILKNSTILETSLREAVCNILHIHIEYVSDLTMMKPMIIMGNAGVAVEMTTYSDYNEIGTLEVLSISSFDLVNSFFDNGLQIRK